MKEILNLKAIAHFLTVLIVAFAAQVTIGGAVVDLSSATGRAAVATAVFMAIWRALRITTPAPKA